MFMYPIYNHNWRNISTIHIYNKTSTNEIFSLSNKIHREVGRANDLSASLYPLSGEEPSRAGRQAYSLHELARAGGFVLVLCCSWITVTCC